MSSFYGTLHPDFASVARALRRIVPRKAPGGAAICVYHKGEKVVDIWGGTRDSAGSPWEEDTLSLSFSTTKGVASTLLHLYVDRGLIEIDAPVARYWPEFAAAGKQDLTVRHLLCHEAGLFAIADMLDHAREMLDWDTMVERLAAAEPRHAPGQAHGYHGLTYGWLVGELVRRVAGGKSFSELIAAELAGPLGLEGLYCGVPPEQQGRCAQLMAAGLDAPPETARGRTLKIQRGAERWRDRLARLGFKYDPTDTLAALAPAGMEELDWNGEAFRAVSIPAANGMFTARSLARLYACLAGGGELDGVRLLSTQAVESAAQPQNAGAGRVIPISMRWRLGYHRVFAVGARAPRAFGHFGFGGSGGWADPSRQLAVALTVNSGIGTPFGDTRIARIGGAAIRAADKRRP
ncbi:MAG: beta-lactamase family protein [Deltaproteobacteria bacterium]|nr:beta-lactamase family protein [Deltaproteobacteria bacterium]